MFFIIGAILVVAAIGLYVYHKKLTDKTLEMKYHETVSCNEAKQDAEKIIAELGAGTYSRIVELKGMAVSSEPLKAEFSEQDCVMFTNAVYREYEKLEITRDEQGNEKREWKRGRTKVGGVTRHTQFELQDDSGSVVINPEGAEFHTEEVIHNYEEVAPENTNFSIFGKTFTVGISGNEKTKGFTYEESIIAVKSNVYILGELNDRSGKLLVSKPKDSKAPFIVSTKSEEALLESFESSGKFALLGAIISGVLGIGAIVYGFFK